MSDLFKPTLATKGVLRPTHVEVRLDVIAQNYRALCRQAGGRPVMAILKANAYGHGLIPVAKKLESIGCPYFGLRFEAAIGPDGFSISSNRHWLDIVLRCCVAGWPDFAEPRYG